MARAALKTVAFALLVVSFLSGVLTQCTPPRCPNFPQRCPRTWNYATSQSWGAACPAWSKCSSGMEQSPLDITPPVNRYGCRDSFLNVRYRTVQNFWLFNTGNYFTAPISKGDGNTFIYQGVQYVLKQIIFHSPSEHAVNGKKFDLEVQFIHDSPNPVPKQLISSVFFQRGASPQPTNQFLEQIIYDLPQFSDCKCGNGRLEWTNSSIVSGVNEQCDEGTRNSNASLPAGNPGCCRLDCTPARCGDGVLDFGEQCDLGAGNKNVSGVCRTNCWLPACGDGIVDPGEQCDDGNRHNLDGCSSICLFECGDGEINFRNGLEQCDNGLNNSNTAPNACRKNCLLPYCGDGVADTVNAEQCDNGTNGVNPSQCRGNCSSPVCGDGITDFNEDCDDGALNGPNYVCGANCKTNCGDGTVQDGEDCDLAEQNSNAPDALCRLNCKLPRCGDGIIDPSLGEQCDSVYSQFPTNTSFNVGNWWCSDKCKQQCGSGLNDSTTKQCDHGCYNADLPNRCRTNCMNPICGDGIIDVVEQCDNGNANSNSKKDACRMNCVLPKCGDGVLDSNETCDDNNTISGDGCDSTCRLECGNGNLEVSAGEQCDLGSGNANVADTCRTNCKLPFCGDGIVDSCEECDDGANNSDTKPNACRTNCYKPYCGDGVIDSANGEKCDLGAGNSDTTVDGCSLFCVPNYCRQRKVRPAVDLTLALPKNRTAYDYQGSISYPPCSENVQWLVFNEPQLINDHQFDAFTKSPYGLVGSRPVQQLGTRKIRRPCDAPPPQCGNGVQEAGEQCDLGRLLNSDWEANRCRTNCKAPSCGDSITDKGEECDDGAQGSRRCAPDCKLKPILRNPFVCPAWNYADACKWSLACRLHVACAGDRADAVQSPINIVTSAVSGVGAPAFGLPTTSYSLSTINFVNTGRSLALLVNGPNVLDGYTLNRIEFHSPSEHTVNGVHADLEAQLLHASNDGSSFIGVAILFNRGASKSAFISQFDFYVPKFSQCSLNNGLIETAIGEECDDGAMNSDSRPNTCRRSGMLPRCGDGVVDRGEHCDDGKANADAPNKCKTTCRLPFCGDGYVDDGEQCDPAQTGGKPCDKFCRLLCGNGVVQTGEQCDNGASNSDVVPNACRTSCTPAKCGDGVIDNGEQCDNGAANGLTPDSCRPDCTLPKCGDGIVDLAWNELCDLGTAKNGPASACLANCQPSCGTGLLPTGTVKQCDNGTKNSNTDGACRTDCTLPKCGDGILDRSMKEECDLGALNGVKDRNGGVPCSADCKIRCGNGVVEAAFGEQCDSGSLNDDTLPNVCRTNCLLPYCGDGVKDLNEECDFGSQNADVSGAPCRTSCVLPRFSDGIVDAGEQCDDGNLINGDGCSSTGQWECGNGRRDGTEECDNGADNALAPNSCRPQGFRLGARDLSCTNPICGDGIIDDGEQCDDGPMNGAGPNSCRTTCTLPYCGDGIVDPLYGEICDNGVTGANPNNDFAIDGCSTTCTDNKCRSCNAGPKTFSFASVFGDKTSPVARYTGSLTTPPCSEKVTWYVLTKPQTISAQQLEIFKRAIGTPNARPVQPLNGRQVTWTAAAGAVCGNCQVEAGEQCDQGDNNANTPNKCRTNCQKPTCGDGIVDDGEQCDNGPANKASGPCNLQCQYVKSCPSTCTGPNCPSCGGQPITPAGDEPQGQCGVTTSSNNSGTIINVAFSEILAGAGCTGPNCLSGK